MLRKVSDRRRKSSFSETNGAQKRTHTSLNINALHAFNSISIVILKENAAADGPHNGVEGINEAAQLHQNDTKNAAFATRINLTLRQELVCSRPNSSNNAPWQPEMIVQIVRRQS